MAPQRRICRQKCFRFVSPGGCSSPPDLVCTSKFSPSHALISPGNYGSAQSSSSIKKNLISSLGSCWAVAGILSSALMFLPNTTGGREVISPLPPFAGSPGCGEDHAGDVLPTAPGCSLPIFPRTAIENGSSIAVKRRGWSRLVRSPSASLSTPVTCYASQIGFCCSQHSSELHVAKKPF